MIGATTGLDSALLEPTANQEIDKQVNRIEECLRFLQAIKIDHRMLDLVMVECDLQTRAFSSLLFNSKQLEANIAYFSTEKKEEYFRLLKFYNTYFEVKIVRNPPKVVELCLKRSKNGIYGDFDDLINGYKAATLSLLTIDDLLDYDIVAAYTESRSSPYAYFKWFVRSLVNAVFYCFFIDYLYLLPKMKPLEYYANHNYQNDYNDNPANICASLYSNFKQVTQQAVAKLPHLRSEKFKASLKKYYRKFFLLCDLASRIGNYLETLYEKLFQYDSFFLDGFTSKTL